MKTRQLFTLLTLGLGLTLALLWLLTGLPQVARADSPHYVAPDCTGLPAPCHTAIQEAVDAASSGDEILIASGVYTGVQNVPSLNMATLTATQMVIITKTVAIRGGYTTTNWTMPDPIANPTTLDVQGQGRVLFITGNISPTIEGLRITGGDATGLGGSPLGDSGGGVLIISATVTMSNSQVFSNTALVGGGLYLRNSDETLLADNLISDNSTAQRGSGGGLYFDNSAHVTLTGNTISSNEGGPLFYGLGTGGGVTFQNSPEATLSDNVIRDNRASWGGGLRFVNSPTATLTANTISNNVADHIGGAMKAHAGVLFHRSDNATLISNTISGNRTANHCGGVCFVTSHNAVLTGNDVISNTRGPWWDGNGVGVYLISSKNASLVDNTISHNTAFDMDRPGTILGGGVYIGSNSTAALMSNEISSNGATRGGGLYVTSSSTVTLMSDIITGNAVYDSSAIWPHVRAGGGLCVENSTITLTNVVIADNQAETIGGGLCVDNSIATLTNVVIADNQAETVGSGLYVTGSSSRLLHTTIARNSGGDGSGVHITGTTSISSNVTLTNTILVSHSVGITVTAGSIATLDSTLWHSNTTDWGGAGSIFTGTHNYRGDPLFDVDGYHLTGGSAAIDKGVDAGVMTDIDGGSRPHGSAPDLGADEFGSGTVLPSILPHHREEL